MSRITFARAKTLAVQYKIADALYPLFVDDPSIFLYSTNGGPSRVTAMSGAFRPFGAFNATAQSPSALPAPSQGNWDRQADYLSRVSTSQGTDIFYDCSYTRFLPLQCLDPQIQNHTRHSPCLFRLARPPQF